MQETPVYTHRHVLILTQIQLRINGRIGQLWEAAEEFGNKLSGQALLLRTTFHPVQDGLVRIFVLQTQERKQQ